MRPILLRIIGLHSPPEYSDFFDPYSKLKQRKKDYRPLVIRGIRYKKAPAFFIRHERTGILTRTLTFFISLFFTERDLNGNSEILILKWFRDETGRMRIGCTFNRLLIGL